MIKNYPLNFKIPLGPHKRTYLHFFALDSTLKLLNYVAKAYPLAINIPDKTGTTPLMLAAESGQLEATSVLLLKDAKYDLVDELGRMAIHRAAAAGQTDSCKLLLFDPDLIQTTDGVDEEFFTEIEGETIDRLKSRALLCIQDYNGMTPLMLAALMATLKLSESFLPIVNTWIWHTHKLAIRRFITLFRPNPLKLFRSSWNHLLILIPKCCWLETYRLGLIKQRWRPCRTWYIPAVSWILLI